MLVLGADGGGKGEEGPSTLLAADRDLRLLDFPPVPSSLSDCLLSWDEPEPEREAERDAGVGDESESAPSSETGVGGPGPGWGIG